MILYILTSKQRLGEAKTVEHLLLSSLIFANSSPSDSLAAITYDGKW